MAQLYAAYITESGLLKGTDKANQILTFSGPFSRCESSGPPFKIQSPKGFIIILDLEESSFLLPRTKAWIRALPLVR